MNSFQPYRNVHEDDHFRFGAPLAHPMHQTFESAWTPIDPALYDFQPGFQQDKINREFIPFQHTSEFGQYQTSHFGDNLDPAKHLFHWKSSAELYHNTRYNSPNGHYGGTISESSSDYTVSPNAVRPRNTVPSQRYISPPSDAHFAQQNWSTSHNGLPVPTSPSSDSHAAAVALKEVEFSGIPDYQLDSQEDDGFQLSTQLPLNAPEELELSDSIATLTSSSQANTAFSLRSTYDSSSSGSSPAHDNDSDSDFHPGRAPLRMSSTGRLPRVRSPRQTFTSHPVLDAKSRVQKISTPKSSNGKEKSKPKPIPPMTNQSNSSANAKLPKSFPCTFHLFGCPSTFANKNEWKRHVTSQHLQLGFYRCDLGTCNPDNVQEQLQSSHAFSQSGKGRGHYKRRSISTAHVPVQEDIEEVKVFNDFNRKDLFTQHCRRMHGPSRHMMDDTTQTNQTINARLRTLGRKVGSGKAINTKDDDAAFEEELEDIRARCWRVRRYAPERSSCGFCGKLFEASAHTDRTAQGDGRAAERAWEERMEHLGRHYERDNCSPTLETIDPDLLEWGLNEGILVTMDSVGAWLVGYEIPSAEPEEEEQRREGLRRRGPKRKAALRESNSYVHAHVSAMDGANSDDDAMAEDDQ